MMSRYTVTCAEILVSADTVTSTVFRLCIKKILVYETLKLQIETSRINYLVTEYESIFWGVFFEY